MHLAEHFTVVHSFSVQLLIGGTAIGEGKLVERTKCVHGEILRDAELKVQVIKMNYDMEHPDYPYKMKKEDFQRGWLKIA